MQNLMPLPVKWSWNRHRASFKYIKNLNGPEKVKVLLAQAPVWKSGYPALLDEPTNHFDLDAIAWLEEFPDQL